MSQVINEEAKAISEEILAAFNQVSLVGPIVIAGLSHKEIALKSISSPISYYVIVEESDGFTLESHRGVESIDRATIKNEDVVPMVRRYFDVVKR